MSNQFSSKFEWFVRGYYNDSVKPPKERGSFAIEIGGKTRQALDMDITALRSRKDIGRIELKTPYGDVLDIDACQPQKDGDE